jgi:hypothetical protein
MSSAMDGGVGLKFILLAISFALLVSGCVLLGFGILDIVRRRAAGRKRETENQHERDDHRHAA